MNWKPNSVNFFMSCLAVFAIIGLFHFMIFTFNAIATQDYFDIIISSFTIAMIYIISLDEVSRDVTKHKRQSKSSKRHR